MPAIRGLVAQRGPQARPLRRLAGGARVRRVRSDLAPLAALGTCCPDHFLRTKIRPLVVDFDPPSRDVDARDRRLPAAVEAYRDDYAGYYERCKHPD